jgi:hypothetical protein
MFRSLFQDHLQGLSFALSTPATLQLHAASFVCIGMWSYALYLYVYPVFSQFTTRQHTGRYRTFLTIFWCFNVYMKVLKWVNELVFSKVNVTTYTMQG